MVRCRLLGGADLRSPDGRELREALTQPKRFALLTYLALAQPSGFHRRDTLLALLWPESDAVHARNALRQALHHLRGVLGDGVLVNRGDEVGLESKEIWCDAVEFERAIAAGDHAAAAELYRGDLLPGFFVSEAPDFERWLDGERDRMRLRAAEAGWRLSAAGEQAGNGPVAVHWARWAAQLTLDDEAAARRYIELCARLGDGAGALRAYQELVDRLAREYGTAPSPATQQLGERLREPVAEAPRPRRSPEPSLLPVGPVTTGGQDGRGGRSKLLLSVLALIGLTATAVVALRQDSPPASQAVAVLPFPVHGQSELGYLREGMVDLLSAKLEGAAGLRSIDPRAVLAAVEQEGSGSIEPARAADVAERVGAGFFVVGDVVEIAGRIQLTGALYRVGSGPQLITKATVSGETSALFELVDDLTGRLLPDLSRGRDSALTRLGAMTTHSLPALKEFLEGERALRAGHDARAAVAFRNAALLDTTFALAQYRLAVTATWVIAPDAPDPVFWAEAAARHAQRLTPLVRDLLTAYRSYRSYYAEDAERRYRAILAGHPDNVEAWMMLGETLFHFGPHRGRSPLDAWDAFARASALDSANAHATIHLARLAAAYGRRDALDSLARVYLAVNRDAERAVEMRALVAYTGGTPADRADVAAAVEQVDNRVAIAVLQAALFYAQDLASAPDLAPPYVRGRIADSVVARVARHHLSDAVQAQGTLAWEPAQASLLGAVADRDWVLEMQALIAAEPLFGIPRERVAALRDSISQRRSYPILSHLSADSSVSLAPEMRTYLLGLLSMRLGDGAAAERHADELEAVRDGRHAAPARELAHALRAEIARSKGDLQRALAELDEFHIDPAGPGIRSVARWGVRERFLRAEVLHALGRDEEALVVYDSFLGNYDLPFMAVAHLRRGEILERMGQRERAQFHYARAVSMWSKCDESLRPLLARAEGFGSRVAARSGN